MFDSSPESSVQYASGDTISDSAKSSNRNNIKFEKHCKKMARCGVAKSVVCSTGCSGSSVFS